VQACCSGSCGGAPGGRGAAGCCAFCCCRRPLGFLALEAGWIVTEVGRQPWVIYGVMRTADGVTPRGDVPVTLFGFSVLYLLLGIALVALLRGLASAAPVRLRRRLHVA
jgi:cytochrome bd-type quinol oxidase subunit 1